MTTVARAGEHAGAQLSTARERVRVTHVVFDFDGGGLETVVATMAARFQGSSVETSLVTLGGRVGRLGDVSRERFHSFEVVRSIPALSMVRPAAAAQAIRRTRPDIVHLHTGVWFKGVRAASLAGSQRIIYTEHGREHYDPALMRWLDHRAARQTDTVVAVSDRLNEYLSRVVGIPRWKIRTIHNGVDTSRFVPGTAPREFRTALRIPEGSLVIGSVGRLEAVKDYEVLLEAAALMRRNGDQAFVIVLFGEGSQRSVLQTRAEQLGIRDIVRMPGWSQQPLNAHRCLDVFVLPSRSEGLSVSLLESMACGIVPIVTDVGANAEILSPTLRDHVVPTGRPEALADALQRAVRCPEASRSTSALVRRRIVEHFSIERMINQYEQLYQGLARHAASRSS